MKYYDFESNWVDQIEQHLMDVNLNRVLVHDFNRFTYGRWRKEFTFGHVPFEFESCDWFLNYAIEHDDILPPHWDYVKHSAAHWLVNFNLKLAMLTEPKKQWRILTSNLHSTVWDGKDTLFDINFSALGVDPDEAFILANQGELLPYRKRYKTYYAAHCTVAHYDEQPFKPKRKVKYFRLKINPDNYVLTTDYENPFSENWEQPFIIINLHEEQELITCRVMEHVISNIIEKHRRICNVVENDLSYILEAIENTNH